MSSLLLLLCQLIQSSSTCKVASKSGGRWEQWFKISVVMTENQWHFTKWDCTNVCLRVSNDHATIPGGIQCVSIPPTIYDCKVILYHFVEHNYSLLLIIIMTIMVICYIIITIITVQCKKTTSDRDLRLYGVISELASGYGNFCTECKSRKVNESCYNCLKMFREKVRAKCDDVKAYRNHNPLYWTRPLLFSMPQCQWKTLAITWSSNRWKLMVYVGIYLRLWLPVLFVCRSLWLSVHRSSGLRESG